MLIRLIFLSILTLLFYSCHLERDMRGKIQIGDRTTESAYVLKKNNYLNDRILKEITGDLYVLNSFQESEYVMVKWKNGYKSLGLMKDEKEYGKWYLYDQKNRLIECSTYSKDGSYLRVLEKFNKKGKTVYFKHTDPPF